MSMKHIKGSPIKPQGGRPSGDYGNRVTSSVKKVGNVKGGPALGGTLKEGFFMHKGASGPKTVHEARGFHNA